MSTSLAGFSKSPDRVAQVVQVLSELDGSPSWPESVTGLRYTVVAHALQQLADDPWPVVAGGNFARVFSAMGRDERLAPYKVRYKPSKENTFERGVGVVPGQARLERRLAALEDQVATLRERVKTLEEASAAK